MSDASLPDLTAVAQRAMLERGEVSAVELLEAHLARIEQVNPSVNAVVSMDASVGRARAEAVDAARVAGEPLGPLAGLVTAHKDLADTVDFPTSYGSPVFAGSRPPKNTLIVERMKQAGALALGKTNTPEFGAGSHSFNPVFGTTANPWDLSKSAGGSSGGAAAALATGMLAVADGSDMGGSLRNPAAWNGIVGMRCSPGVVPRTGSGSPFPAMGVEGPMARNVDDLALLLSVVSHPDDRDPLSSTPATSPEVIPIDSGEQLRVAFSPTLGGLAVETDVAEAVAAAASRIDTDLGWAVTEDEPSFDGADETFLTLRAWLFANEASVGRRPDSELARAKQTVQDEVAKGRALDGRDVADAINELTRLQRGTLGFFDNYDVLVAPVTQLSPFPIELEYPQTLAGEPVERYIDWMMSCCRITALSVPALSLPIGLNEAGLPVGLHVIGRFGADEKVLRIAKTLEQLFAFEARPSILA